MRARTMPKPKPREGSPTWSAPPHSLNQKQRLKLAESLGFDCYPKVPDLAQKALREVEKGLGFYPGAVAATTFAPRASIKRGRPTSDPRTQVIDELRRIFKRFYAAENSARKPRRGARSDLSDREWNEAEFVATALDAAGIPHLDDIRRHFTAPGAALLYKGDREAQMKKLVAKVRQARKAGKE
jgi:hypothetical protein